MTKAQLLTALEAKEQVLSVAQVSPAQAQPDGVNRYVVTIRVSSGDGINYQNVAFYVADEGGQNEECFWENQEPFPVVEAVTTFTERVNNLIASKIADNTIKGAVVDKINEQGRTAHIRALVGSAEKFAFVTDSNNDGVLEITLL